MQEEVVEAMNEDPVEDTTASQAHDFPAFVFGVTNTPNPAVPLPPPPAATTTTTATPELILMITHSRRTHM
eukprot:14953784-Ditylum_brightwellii.AAC.1